MNIYEQYANKRAELDVLQAEVDFIARKILEKMEAEQLESENFEYGKFTRVTKTNYIFPDYVKEKEDEVKNLKYEAKMTGEAKETFTNYLKFTPNV